MGVLWKSVGAVSGAAMGWIVYGGVGAIYGAQLGYAAGSSKDGSGRLYSNPIGSAPGNNYGSAPDGNIGSAPETSFSLPDPVYKVRKRNKSRVY